MNYDSFFCEQYTYVFRVILSRLSYSYNVIHFSPEPYINEEIETSNRHNLIQVHFNLVTFLTIYRYDHLSCPMIVIYATKATKNHFSASMN